jgi:hypothetical protein
MIAILDSTEKMIRQMQWIAQATEFFVTCITGYEDEDIDYAIERAIKAFKLGHSGARSIYFGYDAARVEIRLRKL